VLPSGFSSRVVAVGGEFVGNTNYRWHPFSDGAGVIPDARGGYYYVSNSEVVDPVGQGSVSAIHFDSSGAIVGAERILSGSTANCSGGVTHRGTWLSCEERDGGVVWECDPTSQRPPESYASMGLYRHEGAAVDANSAAIYLTEDEQDGLFYRFTPSSWPDFRNGKLQALVVDGLALRWLDVPDPSGTTKPVRQQVPGATVFKGGEGVMARDGAVYFTTKYDNRVHALDIVNNKYELLWDGQAPLTGGDNLTSDPVAGQLFVAEDGGNMEIVVIDNHGNVAPFLRVEGHPDSEISGVAFSPDGRQLFFSSQRGPTRTKLKDVVGGSDDRPIGMVFAVTGPFLQPQLDAARVVQRSSHGGSSTPVIAAGTGSVVVAGLLGAIALRRRRA
jgi:secreted PhoX family phosphatase